MSIQTAYSTLPLPEAVREIHSVLALNKPRMVLFFASAGYDSMELSRQMKQAFPGACVAGCSTAGELAGGKMLTGSITALAMDSEIVSDVAAVAVENLHAGVSVGQALANFECHFQTARADWDIDEYLGLVLVDGLSGAEETLMEKLGDSTDVFFVGGSSGDDLRFANTYVSADGKSFADAAVLVLLRLKRGFEILKTQSFRSTGKALVATAVDEGRRTVLEFNHKPAVAAYAEALGIDPVDAAGFFFQHPLGLIVEGQPFVRSPQRAEEGSIKFYCRIKEGMELEVLEATDIVADTRQAIEASVKAAGEIRGIIEFQCILRTLQLRQENRCAQYGDIFRGIPAAGFSTYGEAYLGHMNQTSTMVLLR